MYGLTLLWIPGLIQIVAIQTALTGIIFVYGLIDLLGVLNNKETDPMSREKFSFYVWIWFPFRRFIVQLFLDIILRVTQCIPFYNWVLNLGILFVEYFNLVIM